MDTKQQNLEEQVRDFARAVIDQKVPTSNFEYESIPTGLLIKAEGQVFEVTGTKRLTIKVQKPVKPAKAKKEPAVDVDIKCDKCGTSFLRSKFLPYVTSCPTCRKGTLVATGEKKTCDTCSKKFAPSKFNPYLSTCPECRAAERKAAAKKAKPEKTEKAITAKVAEQIDS